MVSARGALRKLYSASIFPLLLFVKFAFLIGYTWVFPQERDLFGEYTLALGLTNSFFIFAGMRARFYVLRGISLRSELVELSIVMALLGVAMWGLVSIFNRDSVILELILLVSASKFLEMFLDAGTSYIQKKQGREAAFRLLNQHGYMSAGAFALLLPFGLEWAVAGEVALLGVTLLRQRQKIARMDEAAGKLSVVSTVQVTRGGLAFTLGASLNSALVTSFLYFAQANFAQETTLLLSKIFAVQALASRIITGNNFYFKGALDGALRRIARHVTPLTIVTISLLAGGLVVVDAVGLSEEWSVIAFGVMFTSINIVNVIIRQHVMIVQGIVRLIYIHAFELVALVAGLMLLPMTPYQALALLAFLRLIRLNDMSRSALKAPPVPAEPMAATGAAAAKEPRP